MAAVRTRGNEDFRIPKLPTYRCDVTCLLGNRPVTVNFNKIEVTRKGEVRVYIIEFDKYIKFNLIKPIEKEKGYFAFFLKESKKITASIVIEEKNKEKTSSKRNKKNSLATGDLIKESVEDSIEIEG